MPKAKKPTDKKDDAAEQPVDLQQTKKDLLARAKKAGTIEQRDINAAIADTPENAELLDGFYTELADAGIQIATAVPAGSTEDDATIPTDDEWSLEDGEEVMQEDQHYLDDIADDSVRLYLREIGKIPLLSADEEFELAQRIKRGDMAVKQLAAFDTEKKKQPEKKEGKA